MNPPVSLWMRIDVAGCPTLHLQLATIYGASATARAHAERTGAAEDRSRWVGAIVCHYGDGSAERIARVETDGTVFPVFDPPLAPGRCKVADLRTRAGGAS